MIHNAGHPITILIEFKRPSTRSDTPATVRCAVIIPPAPLVGVLWCLAMLIAAATGTDPAVMKVYGHEPTAAVVVTHTI